MENKMVLEHLANFLEGKKMIIFFVIDNYREHQNKFYMDENVK